MQKKSRLRPPRTKKLRLAAKKSELAPRSAQRFEQQIFSTPPALVFRLAGRCRSLKPFLMLGESARRRTSSVRSRTSSAGRRISLISLFSFLLYLIPSFLNYFILGRCHLVLITGHELVVTLLGLVQSFFCTYEVTVPWLAGFNL